MSRSNPAQHTGRTNPKPLSLSLVLGPPHAASPSPPHRRRPAPSPPPDPPEHASKRSKSLSAELPEQMVGFGSLAPKTKNLVVGGGLTGFVFGVYYYTMRAVGSTDELQVAIDKFEDLKKKDADATPAANPSTPGSS
ncbi:unnamed protein product [Triticum turgidum subsp. durum]|uniref:Cytochrome c oxidase assembly factor 3 mitochondrial coiled-coil domain-containing protein n=1 Tax=Triticum turgidum subsp. durum TaxID=4567 RepID=A0A9R0ZGK3_TRITD|nr:unnamed protein product [Triticum turgidum subsp. durum]